LPNKKQGRLEDTAKRMGEKTLKVRDRG
jgi:hypothetical protein